MEEQLTDSSFYDSSKYAFYMKQWPLMLNKHHDMKLITNCNIIYRFIKGWQYNITIFMGRTMSNSTITSITCVALYT